jgi:hypothetical protein
MVALYWMVALTTTTSYLTIMITPNLAGTVSSSGADVLVWFSRMPASESRKLGLTARGHSSSRRAA